jgi:dihydrofolate synthase / folylpolyglutamate synthase
MQLMNSALAIATLKALRQQGWTIFNEAIQMGMAKTQWPGRLQWTQWQGMKLLIDGAHNPAAAKVLRQYVDRLAPTPVHWLMGMLSTKDHADIFQALLRKGDRLTLVPVPEHSTADPLRLAELARSICPELERCETAVDLVEGLRLLQDEAAGLKILCGSLYLVGEFLGQGRRTLRYGLKTIEGAVESTQSERQRQRMLPTHFGGSTNHCNESVVKGLDRGCP